MDARGRTASAGAGSSGGSRARHCVVGGRAPVGERAGVRLGRVSVGTRPGISRSRSSLPACRRRGTAPEQRPACRGGAAGRTARRPGPLDDAAGVHDHDPVGDVGDHAEVVGDEQDRGAEPVAQVAQHVEDAGLHGDVERGGRLVGDEHAAGWQATAIAIITRCRMPPESWCGYCSSRSRGERDADQVEQLDRPVAVACCRRMPWWPAAPRRSGGPTVRTGFSEVIGSWKT